MKKFTQLELIKMLMNMEKPKKTIEEVPCNLDRLTDNYMILGYNTALYEVIDKLNKLSQ